MGGTLARVRRGLFLKASWRDVLKPRRVSSCLGPVRCSRGTRRHELAHNGVRNAMQLTVAEVAAVELRRKPLQ